jgi:alpha-beta hydrolase superfamily lysophospholipase
MMRFASLILAAVLLCGCTPLMVQQAGRPPLGFAGPRLEAGDVVSFDGARLGLSEWDAAGEPWAVIVGVHGMNDYANAFHLAAPWWASQGITTIAYDQRGFGRSPGRGVWAGDDLMMEDLRTVCALARQRYPQALIVVAGESLGGAVAAEAFASDRPPAADRLVLLSPAVWGWGEQPLPNRTLLWFAANFTAAKIYTPPRWLTSKITPTDNRDELVAMGKDPLMTWGARSDALYGLVSTMDRAAEAVGRARLPTLYLYGAHDQIIPRKAAFRAAARLKPADRTIYYAGGYHLLMRDLEGAMVWKDIAAFIRDPEAPPPSGAPKIPTAPAHARSAHVASGL